MRRKQERLKARRSRLTGEQLARILDYLGVPANLFGSHCGASGNTVYRWTSGKFDGKIPVVVDWVLWAYNQDPSMKWNKGDVDLPLEIWLNHPIQGIPVRPGRIPLRRFVDPDAEFVVDLPNRRFRPK